MQKNILLSLLLILLFSGLYGCSCSSGPSTDPDITPGLYVVDISVKEDEAAAAGQTQFSIDVKLQRNSTETVTVDYVVKASSSTTKALAVVGDANDAGVDVVSAQDTLTFDETTTDVLTIPITVLSDTLYELDEVFVVELTVSSGANIIEGIAEITLTNDDDKPVATIVLTNEGDSLALSEATPERVSIKISLDVISGVDATMNITRSAESSLDQSKYGFVGAYRIDYMLYKSDVRLLAEAEIVIPAGELEASIEVEVIDDGLREKQEAFDIGLNEKSHVSTSGTQALLFSIADDDTNASILDMELNDTGVVEASALSNQALSAQLDTNLGRDALALANTLTKTGGGRAGFDFSKIDSAGNDVPINTSFPTGVDAQTAAVTGILPWDCVKDNTTGLVWEVKVPGEAVDRGAGRNFYWHDPNYETNGGDTGIKGEYTCEGSTDGLCASNTAYYVADMNVNKLCGMTGWRLPTIDELRSIVDYNSYSSSESKNYDTDYFAGDTTGVKFILTSTSVANTPDKVWALQFFGLNEEARLKSDSGGVRLVNDSQVMNIQ